MARNYVVFDGSNIATEGRSTPSLAQLDEGVRAFIAERPDEEIIVVVDASFGYRIEDHERVTFEQAEAAGEIVSPPAGAIGRGDGFLLRIADRTDATVVSNDSFQEFHGEYEWLFDEGRLIGGKPVPGVGWIFTPRTPVRGPRSRVAVRDAKRSKAAAKEQVVPQSPVAEAIAAATVEALAPTAEKKARRTRRRSSKPRPEAVNEPLPFITFIAEHRLGTEVQGVVDGFTSHGAFVIADGAHCYVPLVGLGDPPPRSAKQVLTRGEERTFVVQALDAPRRGIELALPGLARVAGAPTNETVEADIGASREAAAPAGRTGIKKASTRARAKKAVDRKGATAGAEEKAPVEKATAKKTSAKKAARKISAKKAPAKKTAVPAAAKKAPVKKATAKRATAKKATVKAPATTAKKTPAAKAPAKKATAKRSTIKKAPAERAR